MLTDLKNSFISQGEGTEVESLMLEASVSTNVKDAFLDNPNIIVAGSENDPEIKKLVDDVPGYEEDDKSDIEKKISAITESLIETDY